MGKRGVENALRIERKFQRKASPAAGSTLDVNGSLMLIYGPFDKAQTQTCSVSTISSRGIGTIESLEDTRNLFRANANPVVFDFKNCVISSPCNIDPHVPARLREFDGVVGEVENDAFDPTCVTGEDDVAADKGPAAPAPKEEPIDATAYVE